MTGKTRAFSFLDWVTRGFRAFAGSRPRGARLRAADTREAPPALGAVRDGFPGIDVRLGAFDEALLAGVDTVAASPGVALREPVLRAAAARGIEIVGDVEIFARAIGEVAPGARVLGITGTNGKSTVTALAGAMGRAARFRTQVAGNIGLPVLEALSRYRERAHGAAAESDLFVIELSSYQLETTSSLALDAAVDAEHLAGPSRPLRRPRRTTRRPRSASSRTPPCAS
jgi:UDP-N-acetylmuramoylalanine--D-glutamate ligase